MSTTAPQTVSAKPFNPFKSEFYTEGGTIRGQTEAEKKYTSKTGIFNLDTYSGQKNKMFESPIEQAIKAPIR